MKRTGSAKRNTSSSSRFSTSTKRRTSRLRNGFVVCIDNRGYEASLETGKLYRVMPDAEAASHGYLRIVDESGEDYGYSAARFFRIEVPRALARVLTPQGDRRGTDRAQAPQ